MKMKGTWTLFPQPINTSEEVLTRWTGKGEEKIERKHCFSWGTHPSGRAGSLPRALPSLHWLSAPLLPGGGRGRRDTWALEFSLDGWMPPGAGPSQRPQRAPGCELGAVLRGTGRQQGRCLLCRPRTLTAPPLSAAHRCGLPRIRPQHTRACLLSRFRDRESKKPSTQPASVPGPSLCQPPPHPTRRTRVPSGAHGGGRLVPLWAPAAESHPGRPQDGVPRQEQETLRRPGWAASGRSSSPRPLRPLLKASFPSSASSCSGPSPAAERAKPPAPGFPRNPFLSWSGRPSF